MQPNVLHFIALRAPHTGLASRDMDCISIKACTDGTCVPNADPFAISFNWQPEEEATIRFDGSMMTLPMISRGETETMVQSDYGNPTQSENLLRIVAGGTNITAYYPLVTTYRATCNVRQAA